MMTLRKIARALRSTRRVSAGAVVWLVVWLTPAYAQQSSMPSRMEATVLARVIAYDETPTSRADDAVVVGVVYTSRSASSTAEGNDMVTAFKELEHRTLRGLPFRVERIVWQDGDSLARFIGQHGVDALYVAAGLDDHIGAISRVTRDLHVLTLTATRQYVVNGLSVCATIIANKPILVLNQKASAAEGARFGSDFLALTTPAEDGK